MSEVPLYFEVDLPQEGMPMVWNKLISVQAKGASPEDPTLHYRGTSLITNTHSQRTL